MVLSAPGSDPPGRSQAKSKPAARPAHPLGSAANPQEQTIAETVEAIKRSLGVGVFSLSMREGNLHPGYLISELGIHPTPPPPAAEAAAGGPTLS